MVAPLYNEEENIGQLHRRLTLALQALGLTYEIIFVNDGSQDATPLILNSLQQGDPHVVVVHLSRNFGHQPAISAGVDHAAGTAVILMDGDLQDPPEVLGQFIQRWREGYEVVYAIREKRKEGFLKRAGYFVFYRLLRSISDLDIPLDSGDFCLMDRRVVDALKHLPERLRFVRGLRTFVGFRQTGLRYERAARGAGRPKYSFRALLGLAIDGLVSFSNYPLWVVTQLGLLCTLVALGLTVWAIIAAFSNPNAPLGWASTLIVMLFLGSFQMISLGIMGEYIRRIFIESKGRPTYIVGDVRRSPARRRNQSGKSRGLSRPLHSSANSPAPEGAGWE